MHIKSIVTISVAALLSVGLYWQAQHKPLTQFIPHNTAPVDTLIPKGNEHKGFPVLMVQTDPNNASSTPLQIDSLAIHSKILGTLVTTTMDITYKNENDRELEGQFYFPLGEGQSVAGFALEMNGALKEASMVERAKARQTYESVIRKKIDPGLLEWEKGNNFKTRIYPIPARGKKRIVITYCHELLFRKDSYIYWQPLSIDKPIAKFDYQIELLKQAEIPLRYNDDTFDLKFERKGSSWIAEKTINNFMGSKPLSFIIPQTSLVNCIYTQPIGQTNRSYFYSQIQPEKLVRNKKSPAKLGILWDVSGSAEKRDLTKEKEIIGNYISRLKNIEIDLIPFSDACQPKEIFTIVNGDWKSLKSRLDQIPIDGGSQLGSINLTQYECDEYILFSDGISNIGKHEVTFSSQPVTCITTANESDYSTLKYIAMKSGGQFINGSTINASICADQLFLENYHFISASCISGKTIDIYPSKTTDFQESFSVAGILEGDEATIRLHFGFNQEITKSMDIQIDANAMAGGDMIGRFWATKKIAELDLLPEKNMEQITELGLKHGIVTRNTSMLVLDRIEDYITYRIKPMDVLLRSAYDAAIEKEEAAQKNEKTNHDEQLLTMFNERLSWWQKTYKPVVYKTIPTENLNTTVSGATDTTRVVLNDLNTNQTLQINGNRTQANYNTAPSGSLNYAATENQAITIERYAPPIVNGFADAEAVFKLESDESKNKAGTDELAENKATIQLETWKPNAAYIKTLEKTPNASLYSVYLKLRATNKTTPSFFFDASHIFKQRGMNQLALRILSNIAEFELENHELLRALAHSLLQMKNYPLAIDVFKEIKKIREEEPQSYRDLGLAYAANRQYQEAFDMLAEVVNKSWDARFPEIEMIALGEMNELYRLSAKKINTTKIDARLLKDMPDDIRIVIDWNGDNCDIDLWVTDPRGEVCMYSNPLTQIGGKISRDFTGGYGPEEFIIRRAWKGIYKVQVNYFGSSRTTLSGPASIHAKLITHFGSINETSQDINVRLTDAKEVVDIGSLVF